MSRVTRSKKIDIAEDHTALAIQAPLPDALATQSLADLPAGSNNMPSIEEDVLDADIRGLKAAYKRVLGVGGKKPRKGKNKKTDKQAQQLLADQSAEDHSTSTIPDEAGNEETVTEEPLSHKSIEPARTRKRGKQARPQEENSIGQPVIEDDERTNNAPEDNREFSGSSLASLLSKLTLRDLTYPTETVEESKRPSGRATRQQLVKTQAGQSSLLMTDQAPVNRRQRDDFLVSLFGGRSAGMSRYLTYSTTEGITTDKYSILAEAAAKKAAKELEEDASSRRKPVKSRGRTAKVEPEPLAEGDVSDEGNQLPSVLKEPIPLHDDKVTEQDLIQTPPKSPVKTFEEVEKMLVVETTAPADDGTDDSFVEQIICRSPAKPVTRIEDSLEALDELEEALEAIDQAASTERLVSPEKARHKALAALEGRSVKTLSVPLDCKAMQDKMRKERLSKPGSATVRVKATAPKASVIRKATSMTFKTNNSTLPPVEKKEKGKARAEPAKKEPVKRPVSLLPPKEPIRSSKPATRPTNFELPGEAVARKLKEQREARQAQREFSEETVITTRPVSAPKFKSTKPPTKSTFELPGEALSRRKREAHEARLKAQEEEERKRREFKAKPIRNSVSNVVPRDTIASRARQSKIGIESMENGNLTVSKRGSNIGAHRPSMQQLNVANMSAPRAPGMTVPVERKPSTKFHGPSMSGLAMQRTVSSSDVQAQRQRAKEIYNRDNKLAEDIEKERREREAAAKRSREEAAERGRQASREWAEKQRAKKLAEGDKGMSAGYGPGGQMGLKA